MCYAYCYKALYVLHAKQLPWLPYYQMPLSQQLVWLSRTIKMLLYYCIAKKLEGSIFEDFTIFLKRKNFTEHARSEGWCVTTIQQQFILTFPGWCTPDLNCKTLKISF